MPNAGLTMIRAASLLVSALWAAQAQAYIGPGAGIGLLGSILGFSSLVIVGIVFSVLWPVWLIVKFVRRRKKGEEPAAPQDEDQASKV
jgi:hypothetical protein